MTSGIEIRPEVIRAVLFDLDGTLRHNRPSSFEFFCDYAVELGVEDSPERRREAYRWTHYYWAESEDLKQDRVAFPDEAEFWKNYAVRHLAAFGVHNGQVGELVPKIHQHMQENYRPEDWVPPDVPETLRALQEAGYRLGVLSNRRNPCGDYLAALALQDYFELALVAGEIDVWKPDPVIFYRALERIGTLPEETLYVGDNYYADIIGAQRAGLQPVLIDPENIFPDAQCPAIRRLSGLCELLNI